MIKLVRDKIPEITGRDDYFYLPDVDVVYELFLYEKLTEESEELFKSNCSLEELADVYEVLETIRALKGYSTEDVRNAMTAKNESRGSFTRRIIMKF